MCNKMSDVRLSNASPTLERVDPARIIGLAALQDGGGGGSRPPVRRNLFGSPDPEELQREWGALMAEERRRFAEQWSYDPVADRPLTDVPPGGCRWEEATDAPDFYRRAPHEKRRPDGNRNNNNRGGSGDAGRPAERSSSSSPSPGGDSSNSPDDSPRRRRQRASAGPCSGDSPRKRLRCDDHDEEEEGEDGQSNCTTTTARTVTSVVEETPSKADNSREQLG